MNICHFEKHILAYFTLKTYKIQQFFKENKNVANNFNAWAYAALCTRLTSGTEVNLLINKQTKK